MLFWSVLSRLLARLLDRRLRCRRSGLICVGLEALGVVTAGAGPYLLKLVVDRIGGRGSADWALGGVVATFVAAWTLPTFLSALRGVFSAKINSRLAAALGTGAVAGFLRAGAWRTAESGKVQSTIERVPYSLAVVLDGLVWRTVPMILQLAVGLAVIAKLTSPKYVVALAAMSAGFVLISWLGMRYQSAAKSFNAATAACGALVGDILRNPRRIVSNGAAALEVAGVRSAYAAREAAEVRASLSLLGLSGAQWAVVGAGLTVILAAAAADVGSGLSKINDFVLLQAYAMRLVLPLSGVGFILSQAASAIGQLGEVLALQAGEDATPAPVLGGGQPAASVEVRHLSFRYPEGRGGIDDLSVSFPPGSFSVIVGKNGAGKSTLAQLLAGLLPPDSGVVTIGGRSVSDIPEGERFESVLYVPQRVSLLHRDIRANLFYPPSRLSEAAAIERLMDWEFLEGRQPVDLATRVGEGGEALSGGQVQKLELARLLGISVPCLVLDESTSALNPSVEAVIINDLRQALGAKTTLILVTHHVALANEADQVLWMEGGVLRAVGGHGDLVAIWPDYQNLWR